jgi:hypothetical protein
MITITRIRTLVTQKIKTKKNHQVFESTLIRDKIRLLFQNNFSSILDFTFFSMINFAKILQFCSDSSQTQIRFGSNYERAVSGDRVYGY